MKSKITGITMTQWVENEDKTAQYKRIENPNLSKLEHVALTGMYNGQSVMLSITEVEQRIEKGDRDKVQIVAHNGVLEMLADGILSCARDIMEKGQNSITLTDGNVAAWINNSRNSDMQDKAIDFMLTNPKFNLASKGYTAEKIRGILADEKHEKHINMKKVYTSAVATIKSDSALDTL